MLNEKTPLFHPTEFKRNDVESQATDSESISSNDDGSLMHKGTIGMLGSISIAVNSLVGPAILNLPATYQRCGLIPTTASILVVCFLSVMCSLNMSNVISKMPGNRNFKREIEYSEAFRYFAPNWFSITQISFFMCMLCANMASIVDTSQVVDEFLASFGGKTLALRVYPKPFTFTTWNRSDCSFIEDGPCEPFNLEDEGSLLVTVGYCISMICFLPLGFMDLKENTASQILCFLVTITVCIQFFCFFGMQGLDTKNLSLWGEKWDELFGIVLFNYTLVTAIPAWLYEKQETISVGNVIHYSSGISSALYIGIGIMGALSLPNVSENMLSSMIIGEYGLWTQLGSSIFAFFIIGLGVPLFSVIMRLNLTGSGICSHQMGNFLAVTLPWGLSWMFYKSSVTTALLSWGGIMFTSIIAFIAPLLLAFVAVFRSKSEGYISVWGPLNCINSKESEAIALVALVILATVCVILSIVGQFA